MLFFRPNLPFSWAPPTPKGLLFFLELFYPCPASWFSVVPARPEREFLSLNWELKGPIAILEVSSSAPNPWAGWTMSPSWWEPPSQVSKAEPFHLYGGTDQDHPADFAIEQRPQTSPKQLALNSRDFPFFTLFVCLFVWRLSETHPNWFSSGHT